jgi:hypothetical protein
MARRSLKPQLNQIRTWVRQGRTDAWIAHQLEVSVRDIDAFKREHELVPADAISGDAEAGPRLDEEPDLRAEDDALVAAALDAEPEEDDSDDDSDDDEDGDGDDKPRKRRRGRRGGRGRRSRGKGPLEGTFDHGEEGYGLWLDPAVQDNGVYAEHWAGHRPVTVTIEPDRIVIERAGDDADSDDDETDVDVDETTESSMDPDDFDA